MEYINLIYHCKLTLKMIPPISDFQLWMNTVLKESHIKINQSYKIIESDHWVPTIVILVLRKLIKRMTHI